MTIALRGLTGSSAHRGRDWSDLAAAAAAAGAWRVRRWGRGGGKSRLWTNYEWKGQNVKARAKALMWDTPWIKAGILSFPFSWWPLQLSPPIFTNLFFSARSFLLCLPLFIGIIYHFLSYNISVHQPKPWLFSEVEKGGRMWTWTLIFFSFSGSRNVWTGFIHLLFGISSQSPCRPWTKSTGSLWVASFLWCLTVTTGRLKEEVCSGTQRFRIKKSHQWFWQLHCFVSELTLPSTIVLALKAGGSTVCAPKGLVVSHSNNDDLNESVTSTKKPEDSRAALWLCRLDFFPPMSVWGLCTLWP